MINLIPFYMNLTAPVHHELRDVHNSEQNRKFSNSLLNSILPSLLDYVTDRLDMSTVICCPSSKESNVIMRHLLTHVSTQVGREAIRSIHYADTRPARFLDLPGVHVLSFPNVMNSVVSCDRLVNYYPLDIAMVRELYKRTRTLGLFDPVNKHHFYAQYIEHLVDKKRGVRR